MYPLLSTCLPTPRVGATHYIFANITEQHEVAREISEAISNPVAFGQDIDEDELEKELEELEQEELDNELLDAWDHQLFRLVGSI